MYMYNIVCMYAYYNIYIYTHKSFSTMLGKAWERNKKKRDGEMGKHKLNEMSSEHKIEKVKQTRYKWKIVI